MKIQDSPRVKWARYTMADWSVRLGSIAKMNLVVSTEIEENWGFVMSTTGMADSILIAMDDLVRWISERTLLLEAG